jgi:hypothetical protein
MNWKLNYKGKALVISSGSVFFADKKPKGLYLEDILDMIKQYPDDGYYYRVIPRKVTLGEALKLEGFDRLGEVRNTYSSVDLYMLDPEREFEELPSSGRELLSRVYNSKPKEVK